MNADTPHFLPHALLIGIDEIDAQHEAIFQRLAALKKQCLRDKRLYAADVDELLSRLQTHFASEEQYAVQAKKDFSSHASQHQQMFGEISKALNNAVDGQADIFGVLRYIDYWFERHIAYEDMQLNARAKHLPISSEYA